MEPIRISKILAKRGVCSRREAETLIDEGKVYLNGKPVLQQGMKALPSDTIEVRGETEEKATIMFHKPVGIVSNLPEKGYTEASECITSETQWKGKSKRVPTGQLNVVGRLDINSKGLLLLTQDGRVAKKVIGPDSDVEKEYIVYFSGDLTSDILALLRYGLKLDGKPLKRAVVEQTQKNALRFVLKEGKKRQLRRMCDLVGLKVTGLKRVRVGKLQLDDLPLGMWRYVSPDEI